MMKWIRPCNWDETANNRTEKRDRGEKRNTKGRKMKGWSKGEKKI